MKISKFIRVTLVYTVAAATICFCSNVNAVSSRLDQATDFEIQMQRAYGNFSMTVPKNSTVKTRENFKMSKGETVQIDATYSPKSADVNFGIIDSDGKFVFGSGTNGNYSDTFQIEKSGNYRVAIENNSSDDVEVSGFVYY